MPFRTRRAVSRFLPVAESRAGSGLALKSAAPVAMTDVATTLVVFTLDELRYALHLAAVDRVVPVVEITLLPKAPCVVHGVINIGGEILVALDIRRRLRLPGREIQLTDQMILARTPSRPVAILVDRVIGLLECASQNVVQAESVIPGVEHVEGIVKLDDGILLVHDLDKFFSLDEERLLNEAIDARDSRS